MINKNMYTHKIQKAVEFAISVHQEPVKQLRKGKDVPYITHPLTVGLILSLAGASEDVVIAGILHDTIEDCEPYGSVTRETIAGMFGEAVAGLVDSVTEKDKSLTWHQRKEKALVEIATFSNDSLLVKSGDIISNNTELISDYDKDGEKTFERFNAPKEETIPHTLQAIGLILTQWQENPLAEDLKTIAGKLQMMLGAHFMMTYPAKKMEYEDYSEDMPIECPVCGWEGTPKSSGWIETHDVLLDVSCPNCEKMLLIVNYPLA
jgi:hypothetical protein